MYLGACLPYESVHYLCAWHPQKPEKTSGTGVTDGCQPPRGRWELDLDPRQKPNALSTELLLQPLVILLKQPRITCPGWHIPQ